MNFVTETVEEKQKVLIVSKKNWPFINILKTALKKYGSEIYFSSQIPRSVEKFDYCFFVNETRRLTHPHLIYLFVNKIHHPIPGAKTVDIDGDDPKEQDIDRILWFAFSPTNEPVLKFIVGHRPRPYKPKINWRLRLKKHLTKKNLLAAFFSLLVLVHLAFIPPLALSTIFTYRAFAAFKQENVTAVNDHLRWSLPLLKISQVLYSVVRPSYLFFAVAIIPDNVIDIDNSAQNILQVSQTAFENTQALEKLLLKNNKSTEDKDYITLRLEILGKEARILEDNLTSLNQKIPSQWETFTKIKSQIATATDTVDKIGKLLPFADDFLAKNTEKKYLVLFVNNMELRPGGGFLGSFGILSIKDYTLEGIQVYDVYDADGQLTVHIDPPAPIKKYLGVPHLFLRDSDFSPDFLQNYQKAQFFLEKEMKFTGFSGGILLSTTAIKNLLGAFGNIYLPDFDETINSDNFYLKAQMHAEDNFFPGSIQKKTFLSSLTRQILINMDEISVGKLSQAIKESLDEKQMVMYMENADLQSLIDQFFWSGRVITPQCSSQTKDCLVDYIFPYDANVGANKVNFYVNRSIYLKTMVSTDGSINHVLSLQYRNDSPSVAFPGGNYRNYFQVLLPANCQLKQVTKDGTLVDKVDEENNNQFKKIGFFFELPPQKQTEIKIEYKLNDRLHQGNETYQLIVQKQIGSNNNDFAFEINLPSTIHILGQNYSPLVKDNQIIYNTTLSADKIFFTELKKE